MSRTRWMVLPALVLVGLLGSSLLWAQNDDAPLDEDASAQAAAQSPAEDTQPAPTVEQIMRELREQADEESPLVEPTRRPHPGSSDAQLGRQGVQIRLDPAVIGVAPGQPQPKLRAEGEFIVNRPGRLVRSGDASQAVFVFEADDKASPEPPMILLPCAMLENMEQWVEQHGDRIVFILSGQVTAYRGTNYLLPTMAKTAISRGNLNE